MKRLILHVGTHKTGTTSLQDFLAANAALLKTCGMCYPQAKRRYEAVQRARNGHFLYRYAKALTLPESSTDQIAEATAANVDALGKCARAFDVVVLSEERLWFEGALRPASWALIKDLLDEIGFDCVDVVVYLRRQDLFIASLWNQYVKGATRLRKTLEQYASSEQAAKIMDYDAGLREIESVFGARHVMVRVFERNRLVGGDVRLDFCALTGIALDEGVFSGLSSSSNPSLNGNVAELKRVVNGIRAYRRFDNFLMGPSIAASLASDGGNAPMVPLELRREILARYEEGNARISRDYLDGGPLFDMTTAFDLDPVPVPSAYIGDMDRLVVGSIVDERARRFDAEARADGLDRRISALEGRLDGIEASLSVVARARRKFSSRRSRRAN